MRLRCVPTDLASHRQRPYLLQDNLKLGCRAREQRSKRVPLGTGHETVKARPRHRARDCVVSTRNANRRRNPQSVGPARGGVEVKFAESPDLRIEFRGSDGCDEQAAFEIRRLRDKQEDVEDEARLLAASEAGRSVSYGKPAEFQDMVARAVRGKAATATAATNQVLVLISDSPNAIEDVELRVGASEVVQELPLGSMPYGAVICWWTPWVSTRWCVRASEESLSPDFRDLLDSIPRLV